MINYPSAAFLTGQPMGGAPKKQSLYARGFDKFMPDGGDYSEDDKKKLFRQGLLGLASGLFSNGGGFGNALGQGI